MTIPTSQILTETRELLSDPSRWTQYNMAITIDGEGVGVNDPAACRWCLAGGVQKILSDHNLSMPVWDDTYESARAVIRRIIDYPLTLWNDQIDREHSEVIAMLDQAIERAKESERV
jgi:hypothetical protein